MDTELWIFTEDIQEAATQPRGAVGETSGHVGVYCSRLAESELVST